MDGIFGYDIRKSGAIMTQKRQLQQLFDELGIPYGERVSATHAYPSEEGIVEASEWETSIDLSEGIGLPGLVASFYFDQEEAFLAHRVWKVG
jgi:hypothetical protein